MSNIALTLAVPDYDHVRDLRMDTVQADGIDLTMLNLPVEEIFYRFLNFREWDVTELSFAKYCALKSQGDTTLNAIPVFLSRMFRLSSMYVRSDSGITDPAQLRGKSIGLPEWAQTASVYTRGYLQHELGIPLNSIRWVQAGVNQAGRKEKVQLSIPSDIDYSNRADKSLTQLLLDGEIDAIFSARPPTPFSERDGSIRRLFSNPEDVERQYFTSSKIFPIMHVVAIKQDILDRNPWVANNLMAAFEKAKNNSLARACDVTASYMPIPWLPTNIESLSDTFEGDLWPYGVEANKHTIKAFLDFGFEQGVFQKKMTPEELFPKEVQSHVKV
tara:strand:- start:2477 stop:3466 length:990 start_codon:yes stop_codon:yes gene_type:complete